MQINLQVNIIEEKIFRLQLVELRSYNSLRILFSIHASIILIANASRNDLTPSNAIVSVNAKINDRISRWKPFRSSCNVRRGAAGEKFMHV